ncbi:MAG TPA: sigma-70 family RNA polymerase sigma factor [Candidatus Wallbacteria bacterium]|mgnify:CR=1 FL=1|nr:sigma-70 family RNA polymerase sigma factor [Candidatus Wallbacteria bacterium]
MEFNELDVIAKVKEGNASEFEKIITKYTKMVYSLSYRLIRNGDEARDLTQDVFLRAFRFIGKYNPEFKMSTWLSRITFNLYKDRFKNKQVPIAQNFYNEEDGRDYEEQFIDKSASPDERVENNLKTETITAIINTIPLNYKTVLVLYFWGDYSYEEIADILEVPLGTVKSRLKRAKGYLLEKYSRLLEKWK